MMMMNPRVDASYLRIRSVVDWTKLSSPYHEISILPIFTDYLYYIFCSMGFVSWSIWTGYSIQLLTFLPSWSCFPRHQIATLSPSDTVFHVCTVVNLTKCDDSSSFDFGPYLGCLCWLIREMQIIDSPWGLICSQTPNNSNEQRYRSFVTSWSFYFNYLRFRWRLLGLLI